VGGFLFVLRKGTIMRRWQAVLLALVMAVAMLPGFVLAQTGTDTAQKALDWTRGQQQDDGSFPGFGPGETVDGLLAFVAAGEQLDTLNKNNASPLGYLEAQATTYATGPGAAAKLTMAAVAAGADPTSFGGVNLLEVIGKGYDAATGQYGADLYGHALSLLAIRSVGATPPLAAIQRLVDGQLADGGWSFDGTADTGSDTNTTSLVLQALAGQRQADGVRGKALEYLASQQNDDGGFPYSQTSQYGNDSDANSTALAIQGILAAGEDPTASRWTKGGKTAFDLLASLQNPSGALRFQAAAPDDNGLATYQAVPALLAKTLPVASTTVSGAEALIAPVQATLPATGAPLGNAWALWMTLLALVLLAMGRLVRLENGK
jgi:hypothetical protein